MCRAVKCRTCGKTTWSGCGAHVAQVKARVPADQWCDNRHTDTKPSGPAWVGRLFGKSGVNR